jgi:hypothetical protein
MSKKFALSAAAGALALAVSAGASAANTNTGTGGTLFVNVIDTANGASFFYDLGTAVSSLNGTSAGSSASYDLSSLSGSSSNWAQFVAASTGDQLEYSVVGAYTNGSGFLVTDMTASAKPTTSAGSQAGNAGSAIGSFLLTNPNPLGGSTFISAANNANNWLNAGDGPLSTAAGVSDLAIVSSSDALSFFTITQTSTATRGGASVAQVGGGINGTWTLSSAGLLQYNAVPLPLPLVLMISGLGLMGIVSRRKLAV